MDDQAHNLLNEQQPTTGAAAPSSSQQQDSQTEAQTMTLAEACVAGNVAQVRAGIAAGDGPGSLYFDMFGNRASLLFATIESCTNENGAAMGEIVKLLCSIPTTAEAKQELLNLPHPMNNCSALYEAVKPVNAKDPHGPTIDRLEVVEALIAAGADVNAKDGSKMPLIFAAVSKVAMLSQDKGHNRTDLVVKKLLEAGADIKDATFNVRRYNILHWLAMTPHDAGPVPSPSEPVSCVTCRTIRVVLDAAGPALAKTLANAQCGTDEKKNPYGIAKQSDNKHAMALLDAITDDKGGCPCVIQ